MRHIKIISLVLCMVLLMSILPLNCFASVWTYDQFVNYLMSTYNSTTNMVGHPANYNTYLGYDNQVVFGDPFSNPGDIIWYNQAENRYENRYLGYQYDGYTKITNTYYPADPGGGGDPTQWKYRTVDGAASTWSVPQKLDGDQKSHMQSATLSYSGSQYSGLTVDSLGGMADTSQPGYTTVGTDKAKVLTYATWNTGFSVFTQHMWNGELRYATLTGPPMGSATLACAVSTPSNSYTIQADQDSITVPVTVTSNATLSGAYVKPSQITGITASFEGTSSAPAAGQTSVSVTVNKVISKSDFQGSGTYSVQLNGTGTLASKYTDHITASGSKTITVIVSNNPNAGVTLSATAVPAKIQVDGSADQTVTVNVSANLYNYSNAPNVSSWDIWAKLDGEDATLQHVNKSSGSISTSNSFNFTVVKSKFNVNDFIQNIKVTAQANFVTKVADNQYLNASAYTTSEFYKTPPPPPPPAGSPVAVISAPSVAYAGDPVAISGAGSHSPNGAITQYQWITSGANSAVSGASGTITYPTQGTYEIDLGVIDSAGQSDSTSQMISVLPPTPTAVINITGSLKENRKFTIDSSCSTSHASYPINNTLTQWTITPVSGGTAGDIKYAGTLTGSTSKDILIKKAGTYQVTLTVINSAGLSGTATKTVTIDPDLPPVAMFYAPASVLRNPSDSGLAAVSLADQSYSSDGDYIASRLWQYAYDSDNDGDFNDETWTTLDSGNNTESGAQGRRGRKIRDKGDCHRGLRPGHDKQFVSTGDYKTATYEYVVEVQNTAPVADFAMTKKQLADVTVATDYTGSKLSDLTNRLSALKSNVFTNGVDMEYNVIDGTDKMQVGSTLKSGTNYSNGLYITSSGQVSGHSESPTNIVSVGSGGAGYAAVDANGELYGWGSGGSPCIWSPYPLPSGGNWAAMQSFNQTCMQPCGGMYLPCGVHDFIDCAVTDNMILALTRSGSIMDSGSPFWHPWELIGQSPPPAANYGISTFDTNVAVMSAGEYNCLYIKKDGTVWGIGDDTYDQLAAFNSNWIGSETAYGAVWEYWCSYGGPLQITGLSNVKKIFNTGNTIFAIDGNNKVWVWGEDVPDLGITADATDHALYWYPNTAPIDCISKPTVLPGLDGSKIASISIGDSVNTYGYLDSGTVKVLLKDGTVGFYDGGTLTIQSYDKTYESYQWQSANGRYVTDYRVADSGPALTNIIEMWNDGYLKSNNNIVSGYVDSHGRYWSSEYAISDLADWLSPVYAPDLSAVESVSPRGGSDRYFLWVSDGSGNDYPSGYGNYFGFGNLSPDFTSKLDSENYSIYAVCPSSTYDYVSSLGQQGATVRDMEDSSPVESELYDTGQVQSALDHIQSKYSTPTDNVITQYVLVNEDQADYKTFYSDYESDPEYAEQWTYAHDPTVFDNSMGTASFSGQALSSPVTTFTLPGKYDITYEGGGQPQGRFQV